MIKVVKVTALALCVLVLLGLGLTAWVVGTESGSRFVLQKVQGLVPAGIDLGTVSGRISNHLEFAGVSISSERSEVTISRVWFSWSPAELLVGRLHIIESGAEGVRYHSQPVENPEATNDRFVPPERITLPVYVQIDRLLIEDIEAVLVADDKPLVIDYAQLTNVLFADLMLKIEKAEIQSALFSAAGAASIATVSPYPLDVHLTWSIRPPDYVPLAGVTILDGSLAEINVEQHIGAPYGIGLTGIMRHLTDPDQAFDITLQLEIEDLQLASIQPDLPQASLDLSGSITGPLNALKVDVEATGIDAEQRSARAELDALVEPGAVVIHRLHVSQPGRNGMLEGKGRIVRDEQVSADLVISWNAFEWPFTGEPRVVSPEGTLTFNGPLDDYRFHMDTRLESSSAPPVDLQLDGEGDQSSAMVMINAQEREGSLTGQLDLTWMPGIQVEASLRASSFDPSTFVTNWPGSVDLVLDASARLDDDRVEVSVRHLDATGTLRAMPLSVAAEGSYVQSGKRFDVDIQRLKAMLGETQLEASGRVNERADIKWKLVSRDLASILPQSAGRINAYGSISGPLPQVQFAADIEGRDLVHGKHRVAVFDISADVDSSGKQTSDLLLNVRDAVISGMPVNTLSINGGGISADHQILLALDSDPGTVQLRLHGRLHEPWLDTRAWQFTVADLELTPVTLGPWHLTAPASGSVEADQLQLDRLCLQAQQALFCLQGRRDATGLAAHLDAEEFGFDYLSALLPEGVGLNGGLNASVEFLQPASQPLSADAHISLAKSEVILPSKLGDTVRLMIEPSEIKAVHNESGTRVQAAIDLEYGHLTLHAYAYPPPGAGGRLGLALGKQQLDGTLEASIPDLSFISQLVPTIEDFQGRLGGTLGFSGTLAEPAVSGSLQLEDGSLFVPDTGITLTELRATVEGLGHDGLALAVSANSGEGEITVDGKLSLPGDKLDAQLNIRGNAFQVINNNDARVYLSPRLAIVANAERMSVTGEVDVPRADLTPGKRDASAVKASPDQVLLSDETESKSGKASVDLYSEIKVSLGDDVHFEGFGLTGRIEGGVLVNQQPRTPITATGELRIIGGEYRAYGQDLIIDPGRIYFADSPITQPALDVQAVRRPREGILVGANVQGTLESPSFELFSEPPMTQQEQLSWLMLGRTLQEVPEGESSLLSQAALAIGLKGGDFLAKNLGQSVGLDQFGIESGSGQSGGSSDTSEAALVLGKYLSPKLYVSYGIGLFTTESVLEMQYEISKNWTIMTQSSGESTSADVIYTVETGG